jgi:putative transposase
MPLITNTISDRLKEIFEYISIKYNITMTDWQYEAEYIDVLFRAHPNTELSKFINAYKWLQAD